MKPNLSIITVSRSRAHLTRLFESLSRQINAPEFEVIVSWNGETAPPSIREFERTVSVEYLELRPYSFAKNNNAAAVHARGRNVLFLNDDTELDAHCLAAATSALDNPGVGIVGANLRYPDGRLQHAGIYFREDGTPYHRGKLETRSEDIAYRCSKFVPAVTGAFILMRASEFTAIKFDESFEVAGEDICLCLSYRERFSRGILYCAAARAVHYENATRKQFDQKRTPSSDMERIRAAALAGDQGACDRTVPRLSIFTEKKGWILYRKADELRLGFGDAFVRINEEWKDADIYYYINYGYFGQRRPHKLTVANFTHYDPKNLADKFVSVAREVDFCTSVSEQTTQKLIDLGVPESKVKTIIVGADRSFRPRLTLGLVGRPYDGGRKGEGLVDRLLADDEVMDKCQVVATTDAWGTPVWDLPTRADFYRAIDYLLIPSLIEGGPVPFMEALASGTMAIAPPVGVVPQFPHRTYRTGDIADLKRVILEAAKEHEDDRRCITTPIASMDWERWSFEHELLFRNLLAKPGPHV